MEAERPSYYAPGVNAARDDRAAPRAPAALAAVAAVAASAGLIYWMSASGDPTLSPSYLQARASAPAAVPARSFAPAKAQADEVVRAYEEMQEVYAEQGSEGVARFTRRCADSLQADPAGLDFCLAFDIYASALPGEEPGAAAWRAQAAERSAALIRAALPPGADPAVRLAELRALTRQVGLQAPLAGEPGAPALRVAAAPPPDKAAAAAVKSQAVKRAARLKAQASACRRRAVAAPRTVCASPALRRADRSLRIAQQKALAAGVSSKRLAREQARFRARVNAASPNKAAVARLYKQRTRALEALARRR